MNNSIPVRIAILTISDSRNLETDISGKILADRVTEAGHVLVDRSIEIDDIDKITDALNLMIDNKDVDVMITTGGTGLTKRDVTPEAFHLVIDKCIPGFGELFRMLSYKKIGTSTIQSRAMAGVSRGKLLFALPGSPGAVKDGWDDILKNQLNSNHKPCSFVDIISRI
ncbi:molybdenum cofactor synthesis domain-containing protein [Gluconobacter sphaericus]|uniref:Molybdenum cofactor biosynthesis protein B n=1 Tax=Gluconobacter sphaericus NBRC 12467 TaxID=1307951 RepID=A0AA37SHI1_9PROT|nr:molybdenum cofactor synthesis domain-containing protein [Gluconobacter sphaericus]MBF0886458.1 molybdenum cofactor biosynthesis protein [Gluconobacter sphaericus]GBR56826.1 molybdenum cofactor biosynthesis protein B [Gluconobacter sphaericus NBRC 12467]GEB43885.1 molybdenum cofactor biosynthesis protein B [Gluconobacter sphaericus NBRC 12467]GLQ85420.1 molybdenum cofactor biosynthesis protein B [Gluconobacter sphaericus NBRC 12467]